MDMRKAQVGQLILARSTGGWCVARITAIDSTDVTRPQFEIFKLARWPSMKLFKKGTSTKLAYYRAYQLDEATFASYAKTNMDTIAGLKNIGNLMKREGLLSKEVDSYFPMP